MAPARAPSTEQAELAELDALLLSQEWQGLPDFIVERSPHLPPPRHILPFVERLEAARHKRQKVCISWPPRHAKTTTVLHAFAWWLKHAPGDTCGYFSYNDRQGRSKSRIARRLAKEAGVTLATDSKDTSEWRTTLGGGLLAGGAGGGLTGQGVSGIMVVDDPFKNRKDADSTVRREDVWEWMNEVVFTRLEGASVFVIHTRWHEDDLIGRLSQDPEWTVINLPAVAEGDDILGRAPGEALWPRQFPASELEAIQRQIGDWSFAALYQGHPRPRGAQLFGPPTFYDPASTDLSGCRVMLGVDPAASAKTTADYSVIAVIAIRGYGPDAMGYVLDVFRAQIEVPALCRQIRAMQQRFWMAPAAVEAVAGFKAVPQLLRENDPDLIVQEAPALGDKFQRAQLASAGWNQGRLRVPFNAPWLKNYLIELQKFTGVNDAEDDQVDATAHAWNALTAVPLVERRAVANPGRWR